MILYFLECLIENYSASKNACVFCDANVYGQSGCLKECKCKDMEM